MINNIINEQKLKQLKNKVEKAVNLFLAKDKMLLDLKVYEPAVSHRVAVYLESLFRGFHIDCEYNKYSDLPKTMPDGKKIRIDVLVHKRGANDNNVLTIEIKKNKKSKWDENKLKILTDQKDNFKYKLGVFIYFPNGKPKYKWFINGEEIKEDA